MNQDQRQKLIKILEKEENITSEWARLLFPPEKREYELVYEGKDREEDIIADTLAVPLQAVRTFGRNSEDWQNMLIFGDNLQTMKTLLEMKKGSKLCNADGTPGVRLIYIDPPFSTKQEFRGTEDQKAYQDKIAGSQFLEFIRKRLVLMRELLADDGCIVVHLDMRKAHHIKLLLDEVFSESRIVNEIIWHYENKLGTGGDKLDGRHDTLFFYSKGKKHIFKPFLMPVKVMKLQPVTQKIDGKRIWLRDKKGKRLYQQSNETRPVGDVWTIPIINPVASERLGYPTQKPEALGERVINMLSNVGDLVMDVFAGSGTTLAVAEKLKRRWIGIDCGKLSIYSIQKRMLNLRVEIGNTGAKLEAKPFTLFNAGLYDFSTLKELSWNDWRFFALELFQSRDEKHTIGGIELDGYRQGSSVLVFNHTKHPDARFTEDTLNEIHEALGSRIGSKLFIIAPALTFDFQQDYIDIGNVRYYALRIPYSIIHELHSREFTALKQPSDEMAVNETVEAVGFDFIHTPELKYKTGKDKPKDELFDRGYIKIEKFKSYAVVREPFQKKGNLETLSTVMLDFDYNEASKVFDLDEVHYAEDIKKRDWKVEFSLENLGSKIMAVFLDIYGNEARVLIDAKSFSPKKITKKIRK